jgi:ferric-dicitrate binding protein FerR (iron transport regulator)
LTLSAGDRLVTAGRAGVEVQFDNRVLQLAAHTELRLVRVEPGSYAMALDKGTVTCQIVEAPAATFHLATPSVSLRPQAPGVYRIAVTAAGESQITAQRGHIQVFAPQGSQWILAGQKMLARGPADNPEFKIVSAFSSWPPVPVIVFASMSIAVAAVASAAGGSHSRHGR